MKVSELGEFGLIELLSQSVAGLKDTQKAPWQQLLIGAGEDDAAAWRDDDSIQLATTDTMVQDVHFTPGVTAWEELGWKALAVNLSDIAAMGGLPRYALVSLGLPGSTEVADVIALYQGMADLARQSGVAIVGGDTVNCHSLVITITVLGSAGAGSDSILTRSAALPGEQVAVTGYLGTSAAGLKMLTDQLKLDVETETLLREAHLRPQPRIAEGQLLARLGAKAAIDISDGLISDLSQVCKASKVEALVNVNHVPVHPSVKATFKGDSLGLALSGGEDYELLFTAPGETVDRIRDAATCPIAVIGEIVEGEPGKVTLVDEQGKAFPWDKRGWEHFTTSF